MVSQRKGRKRERQIIGASKEICPICGLEFYDLDFHIRIDEECPEVANVRNPKGATSRDSASLWESEMSLGTNRAFSPKL